MPTPLLSLSLSLPVRFPPRPSHSLSVPHPPRRRCPHGARYPIRRLPSSPLSFPPRNIFVAGCLARLSRLASRLSQPAVPGCIERDHYNRPSITTLHITHYKLPVSLSLSLFLPPSPLSLSLGSLLLHGSSHPTRAAASFRGLIFFFSFFPLFFLGPRHPSSLVASHETLVKCFEGHRLSLSLPPCPQVDESNRGEREIGKVTLSSSSFFFFLFSIFDFRFVFHDLIIRVCVCVLCACVFQQIG